jgi:hypothetical protein
VVDPAGNALAGGASETWQRHAAVAGRHVFYNRSAFDGNNPAANTSDDAAIATDKAALLPGGTATFANYTSYSRGVNGIMVDVAGLPGASLTAGDFAFHVGNDASPGTWAAAPAPSSVTVRPGGGLSGSDRVTITWDDRAVKKTWLRVTVNANADTGLAAGDVFYFGNAPGESGNWATAAIVNGVDEAAARHRPRGPSNPAPIHFRWDYNRDRLVNLNDVRVARADRTTAATALKLIAVPAADAGAPPALSGATTGRPLYRPTLRVGTANPFGATPIASKRPATDLEDVPG